MNPQAEIRSATGVPAPATDGPTTTLDKIVARNGNAVEIPLLEGSTADITTINSTDVNADNIIANNIVNTSGATASGSRRQTVLSGRKASVHADFIERSTGLSVVAKASPSEPIVTTIASGWDAYGKPVNFNNAITSDITFSGLTPNATNFLGLKKNGNVLDQVVTLLPPVYGNIFTSDRDYKINASFNGSNGDTTFIDSYSNVFRSYGTNWAISNDLSGQFNGMNTWRCGGGGGTNRIEYIPKFQIRQLEQWTYELFFKTDNVTPVSNTYQNILFVAGAQPNSYMRFWLHPTVGRPFFSLSNDEQSSNIWGNIPSSLMTGPIAATPGYDIVPGYTKRTGDLGYIENSAGGLESNKWYHFAWVFDGLHHNLYLNGFLIRTTRENGSYDNNENINWLKIEEPVIINLGSDRGSNNEKLLGNISNFAFHPYAKYQSKRRCYDGESALLRDTFIPPTPPLLSDTDTNRYFRESEAIYLNFENANNNDITTKDKYGRTLFCYGNSYPGNANSGAYIESGSAKSGNNCLKFSGNVGATTNYNAAYIKSSVWADNWTVEFWGMDNTITGSAKVYVSLVFPNYLSGGAFTISSNGDTASKIRYNFTLSSVDSLNNILVYNTNYDYNISQYNHIAVSYDGIKYRIFVNGSLKYSIDSQLRVANGQYFVFGKHPSDNYHLDGKIDEFGYVPYCKYGSDYDVTPFTPAASLASSMPDQYAFDIKKMQMYKGSHGNYTAENTLFIGEVKTLGTQVDDATTYAFNGEYAERFSFDGYSPNAYAVSRKHNIGIPSRFLDIEDYGIMNAKVGGGYPEVGSKIKLFQIYDGVLYYTSQPLSDIVDRKFYIMARNNSNQIGNGRAHAGSSFNISGGSSAYADFLIQVKRTF